MATAIYRNLAKHLDNLPGGFPATESGVELRILKRLFTPEEADLATYLTLIAEEPRVVARRAKIDNSEAARRLEDMAQKGLVFRVEELPGKPAYMAAQYVIGIWEFHVNDLDPELISDMDEYKPYLFKTAWKQPQLRTIPVHQSIHNELNVLTYEKAEALIADHDRFAMSPCICRREKKMVGDGCDRPEAYCLGFGIAADYYISNGLGRACGKQEILDALVAANDHGLVLQPGNAQETINLCCCCGCLALAGQRMSTHRCPPPAIAPSSPQTSAEPIPMISSPWFTCSFTRIGSTSRDSFPLPSAPVARGTFCRSLIAMQKITPI